MPDTGYERLSQAWATQGFIAAIEDAASPTEALTTALTQDAERLLAPGDPNVQAHTAEEGVVITKVHLLYDSYRNSWRHLGREEMVSTPVRQLRPYVLTRDSRTDGSVSYAFGYPSSKVHHPSNIRTDGFDEAAFFSWGADGSLEADKTPVDTLADYAWSLRNAKSWSPDSTMIIEGLDGDRLTNRNTLGRLGGLAARIKKRWGERVPFFSDLE
jgi:hypothetical protein